MFGRVLGFRGVCGHGRGPRPRSFVGDSSGRQLLSAAVSRDPGPGPRIGIRGRLFVGDSSGRQLLSAAVSRDPGPGPRIGIRGRLFVGDSSGRQLSRLAHGGAVLGHREGGFQPRPYRSRGAFSGGVTMCALHGAGESPSPQPSPVEGEGAGAPRPLSGPMAARG